MQRILSVFSHTGREAARVCSLEPQEISGPTGDSPPREHTSTALLWITAQASRGSPGMLSRATSSGFSAISSGLPQSCTQQSGRVCSHLTWLGARGISAKLSSYITLEKPMLPAYTWGCQVVCRVGSQAIFPAAATQPCGWRKGLCSAVSGRAGRISSTARLVIQVAGRLAFPPHLCPLQEHLFG